MITFLRGVLCPSPPSRLYLDVNGVGYEVLVPFTTGPAIGQPGDTVTVLTYFHVREQEQTLYGFQTDDERDLFRLLIDRVSGVGPKVALSILSGLAVDDFKRAVVDSDIATLSAIKGLGKKTAERIILELKDKVGVAEAWQNAAAGGSANPTQQITNDTILALIALGYKQVEASKAVRAEAGDTPPADLDSQDLLRRALRRLQ